MYCLSSDLWLLFTSLVSLRHCIVCPLIYDFCLPLWYLLVIVLSVLWYTTSVYLFGISWSLYCLSSDIRLLFTSLVSLGHCIVCPLIYDFCLPLWYLLVIVLPVLWFTTSVYLFGISWSLYCLSSDLRLLFTSLVSLGHCIVCPLVIVLSVLWSTTLFTSLVSLGHCIVCPLIYDFCLPLWYLLVIVLSVLWFMTSVYLFGIYWSLYCLSSDLRLLFTSLVSLGHCIVCPLVYDFCLPLWYLLVIVLSVLWFMTSVYLFGISWSLYCLSSGLWLLFTSLVSLGHWIVCPLVYDFCLCLGHCIVCPLVYFCLSLWYLLVIVLSVLWFTTSVYLFGISWSLYCLSSGLWLLFTSLVSLGHLYCLSSGLRLLFTSLVSLGHCIVCPLVYDFCLPLWYLLVIVLSVLWFTTSVYLFGISWSLYCLSSGLDFCLPLWYLLVYPLYFCLSSSSLYCMSSDIWLLFTSLVSLGHCIVCPLIYDFCLPLWYLLVIVLSVLWFTTSVYLFGISWSLYCLSSDLRLLFTSLVSLGHCIVCPLIYDFCLPLWYLLVIVLSVLWFTTSVYLFGISWSLYCLRVSSLVSLGHCIVCLFTSLVSLGHCIVCPLIYDFCLPLWYLLVIVLYVLWYTTSVYLFGISWSLYCLSSDLRLLFISLVSLGHCIVCPLVYDFCLPLWYLLVIVLSVLWFTTSVYLFGISWSLYCLSSGLRLLFTSLVSLCHCIVCPLIYDFCLPLWYLLVIVLSVLWFMTSVYLFGISWSILWFMTSVYLFGLSSSLYCMSSDIWLLFTSLVSLGHCIVCPLIYDFCLPLWYLLVIVLSVLWFTTSVYLFGISWSLYCLSSDLRLLFTSLVSLGHCIVCPLIYDFCLPLWYLLVIVLSVLWFTTSVYLFGISWSLYCLSSDLRVLFTSLVSLGLSSCLPCIVCIVCPLIYDFCLPLWYLLVIVLYVLWYTTSVYLFGISWSLYCLSSGLWLLFTSLVSLGHCIVCPLVYDFCLPLWSLGLFVCPLVLDFSLVSLGHCIVCPLIYDFCLPLWYLLVIVLSVLWYTTSVYLFGISWSLYCLSSGLRLLFTSLVSLGHCIVCPLVYDFCLPLWYLLVIVLSVLWFMTSVYLFGISWSLYCLSSGFRLLFIFGISWSLYCLSSDLWLLFTSLVSLRHCIVLWYTTSVYLFGISWPLYCLSSDLRLLFTSLVSLGHCIVCPLINDFCLPLWYLLVIVLSVLWFMTSVYLFCISWSLLSVLWYKTSVYLLGISWSLYCLSSDLWLLFTSLVSLGHCIVCPLIYDFCLPLWYLLVIVLYVLWFTFCLPLWYPLVIVLSVLLFTSLVSLGHCIVCPLIYDFCLPLWYLLVIVLYVLWYTTSVYLFGISWSLYCLSSGLWLLFTSLVSLGHCIVCPLVYDFCLPLWYLLVIVLCVLWFTTSVYLFCISWSLYCLSSGLWLLFTSLVSLGHCIVCPLVYDFCLPLWYLLVIELSVLWFTTSVYVLVIVLSVLWFKTSVYLFGISWSLYCLSSDLRLLFISLVSLGHCIVCPLVYDFCLSLGISWFMTSLVIVLSSGLRLLFTSLVSLGHCIVCPLVYDFCLPLWYLLVIVLSVLWFMTSVYLFGISWSLYCISSVYDFCLPLWFLLFVLSVLSYTTSVYLFGISWSLYCLSSHMRLSFTSLVSFGLVLSLIRYLLVIVLSVLWYTTSVYLFGISWSLYCLSSDLRVLFTSLLSPGHCIVCPLIYEFCLPLRYLLVIVLSVLWFMTSVYLFGISWSLYCLSSGLRLLFTSLVSLGQCSVCPVYDLCLPLWYLCPLIYDFCLPLWYLLVIVLSVLWFMTSVYLFGISWSLYCLSSGLRLLFTSLVSLGHCIVCPLVYDFCLPLWYLLVIVLSVLWFMTSVYLFGISWSLYCLSSGLWHLFTSLVSLGHCIVFPLIYDFCLPLWFLLLVCIYDFCLPLWYLLVIVLFVFSYATLPLWYLLVIVLSVLWYTTSVYLFGISWSLYCLSSVLLFTSLVSLCHCIVCPLIYEFCLPLCYLLVIVLSVL